jgi:hypothetical protein
MDLGRRQPVRGASVANVNYFSSQLQSLLNNPASLAKTAGYQFEMDQGTQAVQRSQRGMRGSGNALAALQKYGQGLASTRRGEEIDRLGRLTGQEQGYDLGEQSAQLGRDRLGLDTELGRGQLGLGRDRLGLDAELGRGQLDLGNRRLGLDSELGRGQLGVSRDRLGLDRELGMGQLGLGKDRLGFDRESDIRRNDTTRRGQDFEFDLGGRRIDTERELGLGRIGADLQRGWWDYDIAGDRNDITRSGQENDFNLQRERLGIDRYNARTNRGSASSQDWARRQQYRRKPNWLSPGIPDQYGDY